MKSKRFSSTFVYVLVLAFLLSGPFLPVSAIAHAPSDVTLTYDLEKQILSVSITHTSTFKGLHYIKSVSIRKNGEPVASHEYSSQPERKSFTLTYEVPAQAGDVLEVNAACNIQGQEMASLRIEAPKP